MKIPPTIARYWAGSGISADVHPNLSHSPKMERVRARALVEYAARDWYGVGLHARLEPVTIDRYMADGGGIVPHLAAALELLRHWRCPEAAYEIGLLVAELDCPDAMQPRAHAALSEMLAARPERGVRVAFSIERAMAADLTQRYDCKLGELLERHALAPRLAGHRPTGIPVSAYIDPGAYRALQSRGHPSTVAAAILAALT